jgi:hypothetical protein
MNDTYVNNNDPNVNNSQPELGPGGTQSLNTPSGQVKPLGPGGTRHDENVDSSLIMIAAVQALIQSLGTLNGFLKTVSSQLLSADLRLDQSYAVDLSNIRLKTPLPGSANASRNKQISVSNQMAMMRQQVLQARLKTHQNQEQIDIQAASTTTSNMQQLASILSSMIDLLGQVFTSVNQMHSG